MDQREHVFYGALAEWWPLISPVEDYVEEAAYFGSLLAAHTPPVRTVLELGCGGGSNAFHLRDRFELTLTDLSPDMLAQSALLNPGCTHVQGDMRTLRLGTTFDAVFIHDAIDYLTVESDVAAALGTARAHLRPGGLVVVSPDATAEIFEPDEDVSGSDGDGRSVRFLTWTTDPDPTDTWTETEYVFVLRRGDEPVQIVHETHRTGLFDRAAWLAMFDQAGFDARRVVETTTEDRTPRDVYLGVAR